jgi:hypothetical protein
VKRSVALFVVLVFAAVGCGGGSSGDRIAFHSDRDGDSEIFVMNADGTNTYSTGQQGSSPSFGG